MAKKTINLGTGSLTGDGESIRSAFSKINDNFDELYAKDATDFDGDYNSLTNKPTIPADVSDLTDTTGLLGGDGANTGDITFNGVKVIGAGTASGDGNGYSTLELVPDNNLYANDQYLIVDPTQPNHIHIRAGGTQDSSNADLFLGGEKIYVRVDDTNGVRINGDLFDFTTYYFQLGADYISASWSEDEGSPGVYWLDITTTDPMDPVLPVNPDWDTAFYSSNNYPENRVEVFDGTTAYDLSFGGQYYTLGNPYQLRLQVTTAPPTNPTSIQNMSFRIYSTVYNFASLENSNFDVEVTNNVNIFANGNIDLTTGIGPLNIVTNDNNSSYGWSFGDNGSLSFPDGTTQSTAWTGSIDYADVTNAPSIPPNDVDVGGTKYRLIAGDSIELVSGSANYFVRVSEGGAGLTTGTLISGPITLQDAASTGIDGSITFPDATIQTTAFTGFSDTLDSVTDRNAVTTNNITVGAVITTDINNKTSAATGNIVTDVRHWESAGDSLYIWFDAASKPDVKAIGDFGDITGWTVSVSDGNSATVTATNPAGYFSISTDVALTGTGTLTFTSPDYAPASSLPVDINVGANTWSFGNAGGLTFPDTTVQSTAYPGITNTHQNTATLVVGQNIATRGNLSVRLINNNNTLDVEIKYENPSTTVKVSAYRMFPGPVNLGAGSFTRAPGNTIWSNVQNLPGEGDSVGFIVTDHSFFKIYRVTVIADLMPGESAAGEAFCTIEELK